MTRRKLAVIGVACFVLGLGTSVAAAAYESSGDQFYYADNRECRDFG